MSQLNPLAQTFLVDETQFPSGVFVHSVDLWFNNKDNFLPLKIQIRPVVNGYPDAHQVVPFSNVIVTPHSITVTAVPSLSSATNISFPTPPHLPPNQYALVVLADSVNYELYVAQIGKNLLDTVTGTETQTLISQQPFSGVLFKASNSSTFIAVPEEDLMFRMYRCNFESGTYSALLRTKFDDDQTSRLSTAPSLKPHTVHFKHDATGSTGKFSYNAFKINTMEIKDFKAVTQPTYQYLDRIMTDEVTGASTASVSYKDVNVNRTIFRDKLSDVAISSPDNRTGTGIIEEDQPDSFNVKVSFGLSDNIVSPTVDSQQMNIQFIQNRVDDVEINPAIDLTIKDGGTGFAVDDELLVFNSDLGTVPALTTVTTTVYANPSAHTGFKDGKTSNVGKLIVSSITAAGATDPSITITSELTVDSFDVGEEVEQVVSGTNAKGIVIGTSGVILTHPSASAFTVGSTITQATTGATGIVQESTTGATTVLNLGTGTWGTSNNVTQSSPSSVTVASGDLDTITSSISVNVTQDAFETASSTHTKVITGATSGAKLGASNKAVTIDTAAGGISALSHPTSANDANRSRRLTGAISIGTRAIADSTATNALIQMNDETDPSGGIADSRYITKSMMLKEGFESEDIKVVVNVVRPKGTQIFVYYKIKSAEDSESFVTRPWNRLYELTNSDDFSQVETDVWPLEFVSYRKNFDGSIDQSTIGGTRYTANGSNYEKFNEYAIKIVMASDSTNMVPLISSMGALALIEPIQPAT